MVLACTALAGGTGNATLLWDTVAMSAATGPMAVECGAGGKLYATLTSTAMEIDSVDMKPVEIELDLQETEDGRDFQSFLFQLAPKPICP